MDYRVFTREELYKEKEKYEKAVVELKKQIVTIRSQIYCLFIQHKINKCFETIHRIEAEIAYRNINEGFPHDDD